MAFGVWYDDKQQAHIMDNTGQKLLLIDATAKVRDIFNQKLNAGEMTRDELLTELVDRLDVNDIIGFIADLEQNFLLGVMPKKDGE